MRQRHGVCGGCGKRAFLRRDGTVGHHPLWIRDEHGRCLDSADCPGVGQPPRYRLDGRPRVLCTMCGRDFTAAAGDDGVARPRVHMRCRWGLDERSRLRAVAAPPAAAKKQGRGVRLRD